LSYCAYAEEIQSFEIKTEADSDNITECSHDGKPSTGMFGFSDATLRGMATLPQGNQELLAVRDKVGRPQVSLG